MIEKDVNLRQDGPLVSIIVPVYNVEKYLRKCVDSIIRQTYRNIEIILIDDGSTDATAHILDEVGQTDERILMIHKEHEGVSRARNIGISRAKGGYIMFVDSDDYLDCKMVEKLLFAICEGECDMSVCGYFECLHYNRKKEHCFIPEDIYSTEKYLQYCLKTPLDSYFGGPICKLIKRSIFDSENVLYEDREILAEDFIFNAKLLRHINKIAAVHECLYYFRQYSENSLSKQKHLWIDAHRRGHQMIYEFHKLFRTRGLSEKYSQELKEFDMLMLRFLVSRLMASEEISVTEKKEAFKHVLDLSQNIIEMPRKYRGLSKKSAIILFLYKHNLFGIVREIYS